MLSMLREVAESKDQDVHSIAPNAMVADAVRNMQEHKVGALLVLDQERIAGIFTERDVLFRVVNDGLDPAATPVSQVMTKEPYSVAPSMTVEEAMREVTDRRVRHLPLIDGDQPVGMISSGDLTRWVVRAQEREIEGLTRDVRSFAAKNKALIALVVGFAILIAVGIATT